MRVAGHMFGGAAIMKKMQVAETVANVGVPMLASTEAEAGLDLPTTTNAADMVGLNEDTATYVTAQQSGNVDPEATVTFDMRPDVMIEAILSGGGTENTALTLYPVTTASSDGLAVTTAGEWSSPQFDDGAVWGYDGANAGQLRKITSTSSTAGTVTVAFRYDTVVGDNFLRAPFWPWDDQCVTITLTTNFFQVDASVAVNNSAAQLMVLEIIAGTIADDGRTKSKVLLISNDHWLNKLA